MRFFSHSFYKCVKKSVYRKDSPDFLKRKGGASFSTRHIIDVDAKCVLCFFFLFIIIRVIFLLFSYY